MNITNDNMLCNILSVLERPKKGSPGREKREGKGRKLRKVAVKWKIKNI
jgi:hypothetical protein